MYLASFSFAKHCGSDIPQKVGILPDRVNTTVILATIESKLHFTQRGGRSPSTLIEVAVFQIPIQGRGGFFLIADKS